jgi:hypothetical protein
MKKARDISCDSSAVILLTASRRLSPRFLTSNDGGSESTGDGDDDLDRIEAILKNYNTKN